jgi:hypothetical protein
MKSLLEDVFEAFLGATESIIDSCVEVGSGYKVIYSILENIFDDMDISLKYEDLYDAKTRIKETFDSNTSLGTLQYYETSTPDLKVKSEVRRYAHNGQKEILGIGIASLKQDAQQEAAKNALRTLFSRNIFKPIPKIYKKFNDNEDLLDVIIKPEWSKDGKLDINELQSTKKNKYQSRYKSTPLAFYCKKRSSQGIAECLKLGGRLDIQDTDGMYPLDLLFMGKIDIENVVNILKIISTYHKKLMIHSSVLTEYKNEYMINGDFSKTNFNIIE